MRHINSIRIYAAMDTKPNCQIDPESLYYKGVAIEMGLPLKL